MDLPATVSLVSPVFVGRSRERAAIDQLLARACAGETSLILLSGEAGVGKTRLVQEASGAAAGLGMRVLTGHCVELGSEGTPFAPLVEALRDLARSTAPAKLDEILGPARRVMARLLPNLGEDDADAPVHYDQNGSQLLELALGLIERLSRDQPLLLVIEDLHWADRSTLELAAFLVRALRGVPVALIVTYRSDELQRRHPLRPLLSSWERLRTVQRLALSRFGRAEVRDQLRGISGETPSEELLDIVFTRSDGNAFLVEEMLSVVLAGGDPSNLPPSLRDLLLTRVDALGRDGQQLLRTAAVAGQSVGERLLVEVAGLADEVAFPALREAVENHLLVVDEAGNGYRFRHALARDAVYDDMLPGERGQLHLRYGEVLSSRPELAGDARDSAASLAHHWYAALDLPRALGASVAAGRQAMQAFASTEALTHFERALQIWPRVPAAAEHAGVDQAELSVAAGDAAYASGEVGRATSLFEQAAAELSTDASPERLAAVLVRKARAVRDLGRPAQSLETLDTALGILPTEPLTALHAELLSARANVLMYGEDGASTLAAAELAVSAAEQTGERRAEAEGWITVGAANVFLGEHRRILPAIRRGLDLALAHGYTSTALRAYINLSDGFELNGRSAEAVTAAEEGIALAAQVGVVRTLGNFLTGNLVESLLHLGDWPRVESDIVRSLHTQPEGRYAATLLEIRAQLAALSGRYDEAESYVSQALTLVGERDNQFSQPITFTRVELLRAAGRLDEGIATVLAQLTDDGDTFSRYAWPLIWQGNRLAADRAAQARLAGGPVPPTEPRLLETIERQLATAPPEQRYRAMAMAEVDRTAGRDTPEQWDVVAEQWQELDWPLQAAYCHLRQAEALVRMADRTGAAEVLGPARVVLERLGATPLLTELEALARQARLVLSDGTEPGRTARVDGYGLTSREREVLSLLAAGRSNPQIAAELFISPKTASVHVSNILAKLGVTSRVAAAGIAHRAGLLRD